MPRATAKKVIEPESDPAAVLSTGWARCPRCGRHHLASCLCDEQREAPRPVAAPRLGTRPR